MGGANTEISAGTTNVLLESANFTPAGIRRTSKYLGLSTDASQRFARGVDIDMTLYAVNRAAQLLQELAGAEVLAGAIDVYPVKRRPLVVPLRVAKTNAVLGTALTKKEIVAHLAKLNLTPAPAGRDALRFNVPSFRYDIAEEIDLIEEVARVYGYDNIETKTRTTVDFSKPMKTWATQDELRTYFFGEGFHEFLTYTPQDQSRAKIGGEVPVEFLNPVSAEADSSGDTRS